MNKNTEARKRARKKWRENNAEKERESKRKWKQRNRAKASASELARQQKPGPSRDKRLSYMRQYNKKMWAEYNALPEEIKQAYYLVKTIRKEINARQHSGASENSIRPTQAH